MADLYHLASHPRLKTAEPYPCLVLLHGLGADEQDLFGLVPELPKELFVVSVRAPFSNEWGGGYAWYRLMQSLVPDRESYDKALPLLGDFVRELPNRYPVDPARIFMLGFSQGSLMTGSLALAEPGLIKAAAVWICSDPTVLKEARAPKRSWPGYQPSSIWRMK